MFMHKLWGYTFLVFVIQFRPYELVLCRDTRPVSSRPDFLVPPRDCPIGIESEGNGRDKNLLICVLYD